MNTQIVRFNPQADRALPISCRRGIQKEVKEYLAKLGRRNPGQGFPARLDLPDQVLRPPPDFGTDQKMQVLEIL